MNPLDKLSEIVFDQKKKLITREVSKLLNVHITEAQRLLQKFVDNNKDKSLTVKYVISGLEKSEENEIKLQRFITVEQEDLEDEKSRFDHLLSCVIKSVQIKNEANLVPFYVVESNTIDVLKQLQALTFIKNDQIAFREKYLEQNRKLGCLNKTQNKAEEVKNVSKESNSSQPLQSTSQPVKINNKPKKTTTLNFTKIDKKEFDEQIKKQSQDLNKKAAKNEEDENEMDVDTFDDFDNDEIFKKVKLEKTRSLKRSSVSLQSDSEDDSETIKENKKSLSGGKNRKRVRVLEDSSDEEQAPKVDTKCKPNKILTSSLNGKPNEDKKEITKIINEEETYVDEEGYLVTRQVKKSVKTIESFENVAPVKVESPVPETKSDDSNPSEKISAESKTDSKKPAKSSASTAKKNGQTSILSFFKPKNK